MRTIILLIVIIALYGGSLIIKNNQIEKSKRAYIPTTYDLQKKNGIPVTVEQVQKGKFQDFITISGKISQGELKSSVAPFVRQQIRLGARIKLDLNAGNKIVYGRVNSVSSGPSLLTGLYEVRVVFDQRLPNNLGAVTVDIPVKEVSNVLIIPRQSVSNREPRPAVFIIEGNKLIKKVVEIAGANADVYWVKSGLSLNQTVVTSDTRYFTGGEFVKVMNETRKDI